MKNRQRYYRSQRHLDSYQEDKNKNHKMRWLIIFFIILIIVVIAFFAFWTLQERVADSYKDLYEPELFAFLNQDQLSVKLNQHETICLLLINRDYELPGRIGEQEIISNYLLVMNPAQEEHLLLVLPGELNVNGQVADLNQSYQESSIDEYVDQLSQFTGLELDGLAVMDLADFRELVDYVGGIDLYLEENTPLDGQVLAAGQTVHLSPRQVEALLQAKDQFSDSAYIKLVLDLQVAVGQEIFELQQVNRLPEALEVLGRHVSTNIDYSHIMSLVRGQYITLDQLRHRKIRILNLADYDRVTPQQVADLQDELETYLTEPESSVQ